MDVTLNIITAVSENMGIGINGRLPWHLPNESHYYINKTTKTKDPSKKNALIMGRLTYESEQGNESELRINPVIEVVLTSRDKKNVITAASLDAAIELLNSSEYKNDIEKIWIIGGSRVYKTALESKYPSRLYLTRIYKHFECDTFFPEIPNTFTEISDPEVVTEIQEENGIKYTFKVYEKIII